MRLAVFALAAVQIGLLIAMAARGGGSDAAVMSTGTVTLAGLVMAAFLAPALILAINRKALRLALALSIVSLASVIGVMNFA